jgi:hypothetical protein
MAEIFTPEDSGLAAQVRAGSRTAIQTVVETYPRISDMAVVPYRQDQAPRLDCRGSEARPPATEGDTLWVNYSTRRFSSRLMAS